MPSVTFEKTMPLYAAVGRVASKWAQLEHHIQEVIWRLAGLETMTGTCITSQSTAGARDSLRGRDQLNRPIRIRPATIGAVMSGDDIDRGGIGCLATVTA
jgi:hypothetical protein